MRQTLTFSLPPSGVQAQTLLVLSCPCASTVCSFPKSRSLPAPALEPTETCCLCRYTTLRLLGRNGEIKAKIIICFSSVDPLYFAGEEKKNKILVIMF